MNEQVQLVFVLMTAFHIKHFLCDFPLQFDFMLFKKGNPQWDFFVPLCAHAGMHALWTLIIMLFINPTLWWLALVDFVIHFVTDRVKSGPRYLGKYSDPTTRLYWSILGADQAVHHLTHIFIIYLCAVKYYIPS